MKSSSSSVPVEETNAASSSSTAAVVGSADPVAAWWSSLPTWNETTERVQELTRSSFSSWNPTSVQDLTKNLPTWTETADHMQAASQTAVDSVRRSTAATLRDGADRLEEASKCTASKLRDAAPWVAGEGGFMPRPDVLRRGDAVFYRGKAAEVMNVCASELSFCMKDSNEAITSKGEHLSLSIQASQSYVGLNVRVCLIGLQNRKELNGCLGSVTEYKPDAQRWDVQLETSGETIRANPQNLSVVMAPFSISTSQTSSSDGRIAVGSRVKLQGLQNRSELNACCGTLTEFLSQQGKWHVKLDSSSETVCVNPRNLVPAA